MEAGFVVDWSRCRRCSSNSSLVCLSSLSSVPETDPKQIRLIFALKPLIHQCEDWIDGVLLAGRPSLSVVHVVGSVIGDSDC